VNLVELPIQPGVGVRAVAIHLRAALATALQRQAEPVVAVAAEVVIAV
jgi:hypothetical protein